MNRGATPGGGHVIPELDPSRANAGTARALVRNPRLLVLDEPTIGLDVNMQQAVRRFGLAGRAGKRASRAGDGYAGHEHAYERFKPMLGDGTLDYARGIRSTIVGQSSDTSLVSSTPASCRNTSRMGNSKPRPKPAWGTLP